MTFTPAFSKSDRLRVATVRPWLDSGVEPLLQLSAAAAFRQEQNAEANLPQE
jgi:hypothetical protein